MNIPMSAIVSWLYAIYWLVIGIREYKLIVYVTPGGGRFQDQLPLRLSIAAFIDLVLLGFFILFSQRELILLALGVFAIVWVKWTVVAQKRKKITNSTSQGILE